MNKKCFIFVAFINVFVTCSFADTDCPSGYAAIPHTMPSWIMAPSAGLAGNCEPGYQLRDVPDDILPANGFSVGSAIPLCDGYWSGTTCVPRSSAECETGQYSAYYNNIIMSPMVGACDTGYSIREDLYGLVPANGFVGPSVNLTNGTYIQGDCPNGYIDLAVQDTTFFKINSNGSCSNGYKYITEQCKTSMQTTYGQNLPTVCGILCDSDDLRYTDISTCASPCTASYPGAESGSHRVLRTSNGLAFPLYSEKQTTPSLNFGINENEVCYVNLVPGQTTNAIHINYNGIIYHTVK